MPYLRLLRFTRPLHHPTAKLAVMMALRQDCGTALYLNRAGGIIGVFSGRDYSRDICYAAGKFAHSNPVNEGYQRPCR